MKINIAITGARKSGKTRLAAILHNTLDLLGYKVQVIDEFHKKKFSRLPLNLSDTIGTEIKITVRSTKKRAIVAPK